MRLQVLWIICEGLLPPRNSLRWDLPCPPHLCSLNYGFPWPDSQDLSAFDPSHARLSLRVVTGSDDLSDSLE